MKKYFTIVVAAVLFLGVIGFSYSHFGWPGHANACNWGSPGGKDYAPQRRDYRGRSSQSGRYLSKEQAFNMVQKHIKRLNPSLEIGEIKDSGSFYEAEIIADGNEVIERLAVDKVSGRIMPIL